MTKHPEHICRFNDSPQSCDCYDNGYEDGLMQAVEVVEKMKSKQKIDNGHDCYERFCTYCENNTKDQTIEDITAQLQAEVNKDK